MTAAIEVNVEGCKMEKLIRCWFHQAWDVAIFYKGCDVQVTLLDSLRKRCIFVEKAIKQVGVQNANVVWARAEEAGQSQQHREVTLEWCHWLLAQH